MLIAGFAFERHFTRMIVLVFDRLYALRECVVADFALEGLLAVRVKFHVFFYFASDCRFEPTIVTVVPFIFGMSIGMKSEGKTRFYFVVAHLALIFQIVFVQFLGCCFFFNVVIKCRIICSHSLVIGIVLALFSLSRGAFAFSRPETQ